MAKLKLADNMTVDWVWISLLALRQRGEVQEMLRFSRRGEAGVTEEITAFADAMIFDGVSAELREGCVRVAAGTIAEVGEGPGPGDRIVLANQRSGALPCAGGTGRRPPRSHRPAWYSAATG